MPVVTLHLEYTKMVVTILALISMIKPAYSGLYQSTGQLHARTESFMTEEPVGEHRRTTPIVV